MALGIHPDGKESGEGRLTLDGTLRQILAELFDYSQQIDRLREEKGALERQVQNLTRQVLDIRPQPAAGVEG